MSQSKEIDWKDYSVLVVDDETDNLDAFRFNFRRLFTLCTATSGQQALQILKRQEVAVLVTDQRMPGMTGVELLDRAKDLQPSILGILLTAYRDVDVVIDALHLGHVFRYISKPWDSREMQAVIQQAVEHYHLRKENRRLQARLEQYAGYLAMEAHGAFNFGQIVGEAEPFKQVLTRVEQVAPTSSSVLLRGETGTGKELVAHAIHINSPRHDKPFVKVNCAALAPGVLESELFGHEQGSFTGAMTRRLGRFELADGGTLFLDEVGDLPMEVQIKLLRVLQEKEFERIGGHETIRTDVRVISATNRNLEELIAQGRFRQDIYYRLNVFPITLPPLRERVEDIEYLVKHFLEKFHRTTGKRIDTIEPEAMARLKSYEWPGNVRELENVIERALIVAPKNILTVACLEFGPAPVPADRMGATPSRASELPSARPPSPLRASASTPLNEQLKNQEQTEIVKAIETTSGNIAAAARALGLNRSTLYYRLRKYGLEHLLPTRTEPG
jgi:DNA-binding NtrC family response regulator